MCYECLDKGGGGVVGNGAFGVSAPHEQSKMLDTLRYEATGRLNRTPKFIALALMLAHELMPCNAMNLIKCQISMLFFAISMAPSLV